MPRLFPLCRPPLKIPLRAFVLTLLAALLTAAQAAAPIHPLDRRIDWQAPIGRDHPLSGRIWDVAGARFVDEGTLIAHLIDVRYVVTGESHNNPDHHQLQLRILEALFGSGRRIAVGLEIFSTDEQPALDRYGAQFRPDPDALIAELGWGKRHRRLWRQYRPLVRFAGEAGLPLVAMEISRRETDAIRQQGTEALPAELVARYALDRPLPAQRQAILIRDLVQAHCGLLFSNDLDGLVLAQRTRDATMAARLQAFDRGAGALLLSGYGHARADRGVPYLLDELRREGELVSLLFASVKEGLAAPADYRDWFGGDRLPFDYVWFTPRVDDEDPCDRLRRIYGGAEGPTDG